ncbi:acyltransferase Pun1-like [Impatiens glandulifera]|uniref:acyltransferase Pun1-like n=1 Tax=Impatiens glandulifera TaxID=253017 RepID=UPI001FB16AAE|nr:acyltransferase Pun1-like [Impatiens glandulifera]
MEVEIILKKIIKPSSPTSPQLKTYSLSILDQLSSKFYISRLLFFLNKDTNKTWTNLQKSSHLQTSLSKTLTLYYPFAGTLTNGATIECNDEGVDFIETRTNFTLQDILKHPDPDHLHLLYPFGLIGNNSYEGSLVVIQANFFACGGLAIGVCVSHKVADGCCMARFIKDWANMANIRNYDIETLVAPELISSAFVHHEPMIAPEIVIKMENCLTKRFLFDGSRLVGLKATGLSRVEIVTSMLYKSAMAALKRRFGSSRSSILIQTVNMRPRMTPPLEENSLGNFSWHFMMKQALREVNSFEELTRKLRKSLEEFNHKYMKKMTAGEWFMEISESIREAKALYDGRSQDVVIFSCSSMCKFPFYEVDFGWGKPEWVAIAGNVFKNTFVLMDTRDGDGVEAWVTLEEEDMTAFECDEDLLSFCTVNPNACFFE